MRCKWYKKVSADSVGSYANAGARERFIAESQDLKSRPLTLLKQAPGLIYGGRDSGRDPTPDAGVTHHISVTSPSENPSGTPPVKGLGHAS